MRDVLKYELVERNEFFEFFIIGLNRQIIISTDETQEGKFKSNEPYFNKGKSDTFVQSFYYDTALQKPAMTVSTPILDADKKTIAVVAGRLNLDIISQFMLERSGLGKSGETYLVNKNNLIVTDVKGEKEVTLNKAIYTQGVKNCLKKIDGYSFYENYQNIPVVGFYTWLPQREVCLLSEINQSEALSPVQQFRYILLFTGLGTILLIILLGSFVAKQITTPLLKLRDIAEKIKEGDLDARSQVKSKDEIGQLAESFNQMASKLQSANSDLERKVKERTLELEQSKKELENKLEELEKINSLMVGREVKMVEMKKELEELKK
jgi:adenylate cyclase